MAIYRSPGVYVREDLSNIFPSAISEGNVIALVSEVPKNTPHREVVELVGTTGVELEKKGIVKDSIAVKSRNGVVEYVVTEDFTVTSSDLVDYLAFQTIARVVNSVVGETFTLDSGTDRYSLINGRGAHNIRVYKDNGLDPDTEYEEGKDWTYDFYTNELIALSSGTLPRDGTSLSVDYSHGIEDGEQVRVEYRYADEEYFDHFMVDAYADVERKFGRAWNDDGTPNPMSLAASIIFANGGTGTMLMCVPVNPYFNDEANGTLDLTDYQRAFDSIVEDEVGIVVETSANTDVQSSLIQNTIAAAQDFDLPRIAVLGRDFAEDGVNRDQLRTYAESINHERISVVSPPQWEMINQIGAGYQDVGGQYAAAAYAGILSSIQVQETATRRLIAGLRPKEREKEGLVRSDTTSGLTVIEKRSGTSRIHHAVTTAFNNVSTREINVVRAKDFIIRSLKDTLDPVIIGKLWEPNLDIIAATAASRVLQSMKEDYVLADFSTPEVEPDPTDPTRMLMRFSYYPNYAVNEVLITFSLSDFGSGTLTE